MLEVQKMLTQPHKTPFEASSKIGDVRARKGAKIIVAKTDLKNMEQSAL